MRWQSLPPDSGLLACLVNKRGELGGSCVYGESSMDFYDVLDQVLDLLRQRRRGTYNALKGPFGLEEACLQDLKDEIIEAQRVAVDSDATLREGAAPHCSPLGLDT